MYISTFQVLIDISSPVSWQHNNVGFTNDWVFHSRHKNAEKISFTSAIYWRYCGSFYSTIFDHIWVAAVGQITFRLLLSSGHYISYVNYWPSKKTMFINRKSFGKMNKMFNKILVSTYFLDKHSVLYNSIKDLLL